MKRGIIVLLTLLFIATGMLAVTAAADEGLALQISNAEAEPGEEVTLTLSVSGNSGLGGIIVGLSYDHSVLELVSASGLIGTGTWDIDDIANNDIVSWADYTGRTIYSDNGNIATLVFRISSDAGVKETSVGITTTEWDAVSDGGGNILTYTVIPGTVTIAVPEHAHVWGEWEVTTPAGCETTGERTRACSVCGETETAEIPANGHVAGNPVNENETPVGCEKDGSYDQVKYCTVCGKELSRETITIPAAGHTWGDWEVTTPPRCETTGERTRVCSVCGETETAEIPTKGHVVSDAVKENETPADCETDGSYDQVVYCAVCGEELSRVTVTVPAAGHTWGDWTETKPATADEEGEETRTCVVCGKTETRAIPTIHVHAMENTEASPAACETEGNTEYWTCTICGKVFSDAEGIEEIELEDTVVPAAGHSWSAWKVTVEATCEDEGEQSRICSVCGKSESVVIAALGHDWDDGVVTKAATESEEGIRTYTCKNDSSHTRTEAIEKLTPVEPTAAPAEPTAAPVEPTEAPVEPTAAPVEPTEAPVEPTEAPVEPTEAPVEPTAQPLVEYTIIDGNISAWGRGESELFFRTDGSYEKFVGVMVDNKEISPADYTCVEGSSVVTLKSSYLETLEPGRHYLRIMYSDGQAAGVFAIRDISIVTEQPAPTASPAPAKAGDSKPVSGETKSPRTGDDSAILLWTGVLVLCAAGAAALTGKKKYNR